MCETYKVEICWGFLNAAKIYNTVYIVHISIYIYIHNISCKVFYGFKLLILIIICKEF